MHDDRTAEKLIINKYAQKSDYIARHFGLFLCQWLSIEQQHQGNDV